MTKTLERIPVQPVDPRPRRRPFDLSATQLVGASPAPRRPTRQGPRSAPQLPTPPPCRRTRTAHRATDHLAADRDPHRHAGGAGGDPDCDANRTRSHPHDQPDRHRHGDTRRDVRAAVRRTGRHHAAGQRYAQFEWRLTGNDLGSIAMCGIVGYVGPRAALDVVVEGLRRLEYRGYDSAGVAVIGPAAGGGALQVAKKAGRIENLDKELAEQSITGNTGIGHTRWATHGAPNDVNAHPHLTADGRIAVVHNGIIENFTELRGELETRGRRVRQRDRHRDRRPPGRRAPGHARRLARRRGARGVPSPGGRVHAGAARPRRPGRRRRRAPQFPAGARRRRR